MTQTREDIVYTSLVELDFDSYKLYDHTRCALHNYFYHHIPPGSFLTAVLTGESREVCLQYADAWNCKSIDEIFRFVNEQFPPHVHGSPTAYISWVWPKNG